MQVAERLDFCTGGSTIYSDGDETVTVSGTINDSLMTGKNNVNLEAGAAIQMTVKTGKTAGLATPWFVFDSIISGGKSDAMSGRLGTSDAATWTFNGSISKAYKCGDACQGGYIMDDCGADDYYLR
jgi:hypothetical protein